MEWLIEELKALPHALQTTEKVRRPVVGLLVIIERQVTYVGTVEMSSIGKSLCHHCHVGGVHSVLVGDDGECRDRDIFKVCDAVPSHELGILAHVQFARPLHGDMNCLVDVGKPSNRWLGPSRALRLGS